MQDNGNNIVMVVEDDSDIRESLIEILEDKRYQPIGAANGKEALQQLRTMSTKPGVILLDLMMPTMDGRTFRTLMLEDAELKAIPVVILSAHTNLRQTAQEMGANGYLRKPLQVDALLALVRELCKSATV